MSPARAATWRACRPKRQDPLATEPDERFWWAGPNLAIQRIALVDGDKIVCTPGGKDATLVALNKMTGEMIWKTEVPEPSGGSPEGPGRRGGGRPGFRDSGASYSSAMAIDFEGIRNKGTGLLSGFPVPA